MSTALPEYQADTPRDSAILALRTLQFGAVAVVLAASRIKAFELDRFFVPKDLVLHITALVALFAVIRRFRDIPLKRVDALLIAFIGLSTISTVFATNHWVAIRALGLSASGIAVFFAARAVRVAGHSRKLLGILAFAVVAGALTALLQTYGIRTEFFSINRAPGGTLGNRNFVAHLAAFGLPLVLLAALRARNAIGYLLRAVAVTVVLATLVITRSRAAWLAFAAVVVIFGFAMLFGRAMRTSRRTWARLAGIVFLAVAGVGAAVFMPNSLRWNSANPYLESVKGVANYQDGSGHGRIIQYRQSLGMALHYPLFGVGPGNWPVVYPKHAARRDPSMDNSEPGTTSNPWPSSDWVAFIAERGFAAAAALLVAFATIAFQCMRRLYRSDDTEEALENAALLATLAAVAIAGAFDAVLLLALPTLIVWATIGAIWSPDTSHMSPTTPAFRRTALVMVAILATVGALRSTSQLVGMLLYRTSNTSRLVWSARVDPGSYRAHLQLARGGALNRTSRCGHARAARKLFPSASAARNAASGCGKR
jgi:O-antigen ligase